MNPFTGYEISFPAISLYPEGRLVKIGPEYLWYILVKWGAYEPTRAFHN